MDAETVSVTPKKPRKPNWTSDECLTLVQLVEGNKDVIRGKFTSKLSSDDKKNKWRVITQSINQSHPHVVRGCDEVEKKWYNLLSKSRQEISAFRSGIKGTGGGPSTSPLSAVSQTVEAILGETNVSIAGLEEGMDTTMLQVLNMQPSANGESSTSATSPQQIVSAVEQQVSLPAVVQYVDPDIHRKTQLEIQVLEAKLQYYNMKIKKLKSEQ